eukprot:4449561-Amphidinium_carterae.3
MDNEEHEEHLVAARTAGVVRCRTVRRRPGTPWDAKGRLATPVPMMGGMQATPATATASSGGAEGSTDRVTKVDESPA